jgi:hypothetical protein
VQHTPPTGTTLTEFRRFLNTDFGTLRMNAKSTHTFAPLTSYPLDFRIASSSIRIK